MNTIKYITVLLIASLVIACSKDDEIETVVTPPPADPGCDQGTCWDNSIYVCRDSTYIKLFTRNQGWTGGDATYSVDLMNGKTLWMFGDTFIDQVNPDRSRPSFRLINNSLVLQEGSTMKTFHGGTAQNPQAFAKPPEDGQWYWPGDGTIAGGKLYLFMHGFGTGGQGAWDFFRTSIDLLTIDPQTLEIQNSVRLFTNPTISWGAALMEDVDYTYIYGVQSEDQEKRLYVARSSHDLSDVWEYFNGTGWSDAPSMAKDIYNGVSEQFSVFKDREIFYFLTQDNLFGNRIYLFTATSPQGPFENLRVAYCTPETEGNIFTYNAFAHPQVYQDSLLISYNVNSFDHTDILKSADNYRPYFVRIGGWRKQ